MADRWVLPWLFNAQAATVNWNAERERRQYEGPVLETGEEPRDVQLRWLLHPALGLPLTPFTVWRLLEPAGAVSDQELMARPDWEAVEIVGLPVDASWEATGYATIDQGPLDAPRSPVDAALRRLLVGAPRLGWDTLQQDGADLPLWEASDPRAFLDDLLSGRLLGGLQAMLVAQPDPLTHATYVEKIDEGGALRLHPSLIGATSNDVGVPDRPASTAWHPLGLLAVGAGTDALASLALGFGTAVEGPDIDDAAFMVTVPHRLTIAGQEFDFELAAVARLDRQPGPPDPPANLTTATIVRNRPAQLDGPYRESVGVSWQRPFRLWFAAQPSNDPYPASYAIGAFGPGARRAAILLTRRPEAVGGWLPFVTSAPDASAPGSAPQSRFVDHHSLVTTVGGEFIPDVIPDSCTYSVAAQDLFGRWSAWSTVGYEPAREATQAPTVHAVRLDDERGALEVDFGWDWSDRSPRFVELSGVFEDDPGNALLTARLTFAGNPEPQLTGTPGGTIVPLDAKRAPIAEYGAAQDRPGEEPAWRSYRLRATIPLAFNGQRRRTFAVSGRGQRHLHEAFIPGFNISPFGPAARVTVYDPEPPNFVLPPTPEIPQWASLPDAAGVSRAVLTWPGDASVAGYVLYEATETALLSALGLASPDTAASLIERLATLRGRDLPALRRAFRRLRKELIPPQTPTTSFEVALPRGSAVLHFYALTAFSRNQVESAWPTDAKQFIAVAAPRPSVPAAPLLEATAQPAAATPRVRVQLWPGNGPTPATIEIFRTAREALAAEADLMGPPITTINVNGADLVFDDEAAPPGWHRLWYRAVAWTADEPTMGLIGGRSLASAPVSTMVPPTAPPAIVNLRADQEGSSESESLICWESDVPVAMTPFGPHITALHTFDVDGSMVLRLSGQIDALTSIPNPAALPPPDPDQRAIVRYSPDGATPRFYAWVPRPDPNQPFQATVMMIDPLGRVSRADVDVPPLAPEPQLGPVAITPLSPSPRFSVSWDIPMEIPEATRGQHTLRVDVAMLMDMGNVTIESTLAQVIDVEQPATFSAYHQIARQAGGSTYFLLLRRVPQPLQATVTLTDPYGRSVQQIGSLQ